MKHSKFFQVIVIFTCLFLGSLQASQIDLGELSREEGTFIVPISIESNSSEINILVNRAFNAHGAYKITSNKESMYIFEFNEISPNEVLLKITLNSSKQIQTQTQIHGTNLTETILKACDNAVEKTIGMPGFFSGKIAFVGHRNNKSEIYIGDLFFKNIKQLTFDEVDVVFPKWAPDAKNIIYTSYYKTGFPDLFVINTTTREKKTIASYTGSNIGGIFSPNGEQIAMILSSSGNPELYITDRNGRFPRRLTKTKNLEAAPCWSPNGKTIYFSSDALGSPQIYMINNDGENMKRISTNISRYCDEPTANPIQPQKIAFTAAMSGSFQTALFDFDTQESHFITKGVVDYIEPCWTNDGRHLIVTRRNGKINELCIVDSQTGKETPIHSQDFGCASMASFIYQ